MTKTQLQQARRQAVRDGFREYGDGTYMRLEVRINECGKLENVCIRRHADGTTMVIRRSPRLCANWAGR